MRTARITREIRVQAESIGVRIIRAKRYTEGKHKLIGIHLLMPTQRELEDAMSTAERDLFRCIVIHSFDSWAPGAMRRRLKLIHGGAA